LNPMPLQSQRSAQWHKGGGGHASSNKVTHFHPNPAPFERWKNLSWLIASLWSPLTHSNQTLISWSLSRNPTLFSTRKNSRALNQLMGMGWSTC
jgi:hypothetical protein